MKKPCGTSPALSLQIRGSPFRRRTNFFSQTLADHVLGNTSSFHLQLLRPIETDMLTVPHRVAQPGWQSACKLHSEKRLPAGWPHGGQLHRVLQPGPFRGPQLRARCADRHDERSCVSEWRWSFSLFIQKKCNAKTWDCGQHPLVGDSVCGRCLLDHTTPLKWKVRHGRRIHLV